MASSPEPFGRDGYYYLLQIQSLLTNGRLRFPSVNVLSLAILAGCHTLIANPVVAVKFVSAAACGALILLICLTGSSLSGEPRLGLLGGLLAATAGPQAYFAAEYLANLVGMVMWLVSVLALVTAARAEPRSWLWRVLVLLSFLMASACHASAFLASVVVLVTWTAMSRTIPRTFTWPTILVVAMICATATPWARLRPYVQFVPSFGCFTQYSGAYSTLLLMILALMVALSKPVGRASPEVPATNRPVLAAISVLAVGWCINPFLVYSNTPAGIPDRLALWGWIFSALLVPVLLVRARRGTLALRIAGWTTCVAVFVVGLSYRSPIGASARFLNERRNLLETFGPTLRQGLPADAVIVAEHGLQFALQYRWGLRSVSNRSTLGGDSSASTVWWLLRVPKGLRIDDRLPGSASGPWCLVKERDLLAWFEAASEPQHRAILSANPYHLARDYYMSKPSR